MSESNFLASDVARHYQKIVLELTRERDVYLEGSTIARNDNVRLEAELAALRMENERLKARVIEVDGYYDKAAEDGLTEKKARETAEDSLDSLIINLHDACYSCEDSEEPYSCLVNRIDIILRAALGSRG